MQKKHTRYEVLTKGLTFLLNMFLKTLINSGWYKCESFDRQNDI